MTTPDPRWLQRHLETDEARAWCGLGLTCICTGVPRDRFAAAMLAASGVAPGPTQEALAVLVPALRALSRDLEDLLRGRDTVVLILRDVSRWAEDLEVSLARALGDTWARRVLGAFTARVGARLAQRELERQAVERRRAAGFARDGARRARKPAWDARWRARLEAELTGDATALPSQLPGSRRGQLRPAYFRTEYVVDGPDGELVLRHGRQHPTLDRALRSLDPAARHWVFVTAWNPRGQARTRLVNEAAHAALRRELLTRGWTFLEAMGRASAGAAAWAEPSLLVLIPRRSDALALGAAWAQDAVLLGRIGGHATVAPCPLAP